MHQVYYAKIKPLRRKDRYELYYRYLPESRKKRVDNYVKEEDKLRSVAAFTLLIKLLNDYKINYHDEDFRIDENGKLFLNQSNIYLNLSHSGKYVVAAISDHLIGVDVEENRREIKYKELIDYVFNEEEKKEFRHAINRRIFFYQIWTLKESFVKNLGQGLNIGLDTFEMILENEISVI